MDHGFFIMKYASLHALQQFGNPHLDLQNHNITVFFNTERLVRFGRKYSPQLEVLLNKETNPVG